MIMKYKSHLMMLVLALSASLLSVAQTSLQQGSQITAEENVVSGKPYQHR